MAGIHAKKSPSGAKKLHNCPGSYAFVDSLPDEMRRGSGRAAQLGTASHFLLEKCLASQTRPEVFRDRIIEIIVNAAGEEGCSMLKAGAKAPKQPSRVWFIVDDEMIDNVTLAYDYVEERCSALGVPMTKLQLETRTNPVPDRDDTPGTADITIDAWPAVLEVVDYKNGRVLVEHEDAPQLLAYLAGKAHDLGWDYETYRIAVVQPNGRHSEGKVRPFEISADKLRAFVDKHRAAAERADEAALVFTENGLDPNHILDDGQRWGEVYLGAGDHCDFCDAAMVCPAYKAFRKEQAKLDFDDPEIPAAKGLLVTANAEALSIIERAPYMVGMIRAARRHLNAEAQAGRMPEGMKYVRARGKREWDRGEDEWLSDGVIAARMVKAGLIGDNEQAKLWKPATLITGPQAEKLLPAKKRAEFSDSFLKKKAGGLKMVLESEPGEAVVVNPADEFEDDEEEEY